MSILGLLVFIILSGFVLWLVNVLIPMAPLIKRLLNLVVFGLLLVYVLEFFHMIPMILPISNIFQ